MNVVFLAFAYLRYHWGRSLIVILVLALILVVPMATRILLAESEASLTARAEATPLLLGRRGSALDISMAALYFTDDQPDAMPMSEVERIWDSELAIPIPLETSFDANGYRLVGTSLDYFDFRNLTVESGRQLALLGEAVVGAEVARELQLSIGDSLISTPQNLFDLDGVYPLEMPVVGILGLTNSPDDNAVFVDIKTTWVISGIGHGHEYVVTAEDIDEDRDIVAGADIIEYQRITTENIESFHFHGDTGTYPVSTIIVAPFDTRAATILKGRYLDPEGSTQLIEPGTVIRNLIDRILRIRTVLDIVTAIIAVAAIAALGLAVFLSLRLRQREIETAVKLGARRGMVIQLLTAEIAIIILIAAGLASIGAVYISAQASGWIEWLLNTGV